MEIERTRIMKHLSFHTSQVPDALSVIPFDTLFSVLAVCEADCPLPDLCKPEDSVLVSGELFLQSTTKKSSSE